MNATNITANSAATTFSARRLSQASPAGTGIALLQRVDLLEHALRPFLRLVGGEVDLLRVGAERGDVRRVDLQAVRLAEGVGELRLPLQVLGSAPLQRL